MSAIQQFAFDLLLNAILQIGLLSIVVISLSRLVAKAQARHQFFFYYAALLSCVAVPAVNTLWPSLSTALAQNAPAPWTANAAASDQPAWIWRGFAAHSDPFRVPPILQTAVLGIWAAFVLSRLVCLSAAAYRVRQIRRTSSPLSALHPPINRHIALGNTALLESSEIDDPLTLGVFRPAIVLPRKLLPGLQEQELTAILAHEHRHVQRRDFPLHILAELLSLPFAWHPGVRYLMSRLSATREFDCDDYAAALLGERRTYAAALLRLAAMCLNLPRPRALALGIFDGDNLESRIIRLTQRSLALSRTGFLGLALLTTSAFASAFILLHAMSFPLRAEPSSIETRCAGTWNWMFEGRSFATLVLTRNTAGLTGSVTESRIALNDDGSLLRADPSDDTTPRRIARAWIQGSVLHILVTDGFEFTMTLQDATHARILPAGAPSHMKPIPARRVQ